MVQNSKFVVSSMTHREIVDRNWPSFSIKKMAFLKRNFETYFLVLTPAQIFFWTKTSAAVLLFEIRHVQWPTRTVWRARTVKSAICFLDSKRERPIEWPASENRFQKHHKTILSQLLYDLECKPTADMSITDPVKPIYTIARPGPIKCTDTSTES